MKGPEHKSEAALNGTRLKQLCPTACALENFSNEHFLYCQYYFSMSKHGSEVKPDCLRNSILDDDRKKMFLSKFHKVKKLVNRNLDLKNLR